MATNIDHLKEERVGLRDMPDKFNYKQLMDYMFKTFTDIFSDKLSL